MSQSNKLKIDTEKCRKYKSKMVSRIPVASYPAAPLYNDRWKQTGVQTIFRSSDTQKYCNSLTSYAEGHKKVFHVKGWPFLTANLDLRSRDQKKANEKQKDLSHFNFFQRNIRPPMKDASVSVSINSMPNESHTTNSKDIDCINAIEKHETDIQRLCTTNRLLKLELTLLTDFINLGYEALNRNNIVTPSVDGKIPTSYKLREIVLTCVQYCKSHGKRLQELKEMEKKYEAVQKFLTSSKAGQNLEDVCLDRIEGDLNLSVLKDGREEYIKCNTVDVATEYTVTFESATLNYFSFQSKRKSNCDITEIESDMNNSKDIKLKEYQNLKRHIALVKTLVDEQEAMVRELSDLADELGVGATVSPKDLDS